MSNIVCMVDDKLSNDRLAAGSRAISAIRLAGGRVCLDFVNTIDDRFAEVSEDYIPTPERYLEWSRYAGLILATEHVDTVRTPADRVALMADIAAFRSALYEIFVARTIEKPITSAAVRLLDVWLHRAWSNLSLQDDGVLGWNPDAFDVWLPLKRIALSALELLQEPERHRVKACAAGDKCGWLFFDTSKNGSRRWCAMETCGTAHKMARYREKSK